MRAFRSGDEDRLAGVGAALRPEVGLAAVDVELYDRGGLPAARGAVTHAVCVSVGGAVAACVVDARQLARAISQLLDADVPAAAERQPVAAHGRWCALA